MARASSVSEAVPRQALCQPGPRPASHSVTSGPALAKLTRLWDSWEPSGVCRPAVCPMGDGGRVKRAAHLCRCGARASRASRRAGLDVWRTRMPPHRVSYYGGNSAREGYGQFIKPEIADAGQGPRSSLAGGTWCSCARHSCFGRLASPKRILATYCRPREPAERTGGIQSTHSDQTRCSLSEAHPSRLWLSAGCSAPRSWWMAIATA